MSHTPEDIRRKIVTCLINSTHNIVTHSGYLSEIGEEIPTEVIESVHQVKVCNLFFAQPTHLYVTYRVLTYPHGKYFSHDIRDRFQTRLQEMVLKYFSLRVDIRPFLIDKIRMGS